MALPNVRIEHGCEVFVDTAGLIGILAPDDELHQSATSMLSRLNQAEAILITTELVLIEFANSLSRGRFRQRATAVIDDLITQPNSKVFWSSRQLFDSA